MTSVIGLTHLEDPGVLKSNDAKELFLLPKDKNVKKLAESTFTRLSPSDAEAEGLEEIAKIKISETKPRSNAPEIS